MLGLLGLPNDTTMETRSFGIIEERMAPVLWDLYNEILFENLTEEVRRSINDNTFVLWKHTLAVDNDF
jgi:hypothetical protein